MIKITVIMMMKIRITIMINGDHHNVITIVSTTTIILEATEYYLSLRIFFLVFLPSTTH